MEVPLHFEPGVTVISTGLEDAVLDTPSGKFLLAWEGSAEWTVAVLPDRVSPSYGVVVPNVCIQWAASARMPCVLRYCLYAESAKNRVSLNWRRWLSRGGSP
jgi:hypothetical protein